MKFASGYNNVSQDVNKPFTAKAVRGDGTAKNYNASVQAKGTTITESSLSSNQLNGNSKIDSVTKMDDDSSAQVAQSAQGKLL